MVQVSPLILLCQIINMKGFRNNKGFSLIETVLYIGILAIVLPLLMGTFLLITQRHNTIDFRTRAEQQAAQVFSTLSYELAEAAAIDVTNSTLGVDESVFIYQDQAGVFVTIDAPITTEEIGGHEKSIHRLRFQRTGESAVWVTDYRANVTVWNVDVVRDGSGTLTGMNFSLTVDMLDSTGVIFDSASIDTTTTISLQPQLTEL